MFSTWEKQLCTVIYSKSDMNSDRFSKKKLTPFVDRYV